MENVVNLRDCTTVWYSGMCRRTTLSLSLCTLVQYPENIQEINTKMCQPTFFDCIYRSKEAMQLQKGYLHYMHFCNSLIGM